METADKSRQSSSLSLPLLIHALSPLMNLAIYLSSLRLAGNIFHVSINLHLYPFSELQSLSPISNHHVFIHHQSLSNMSRFRCLDNLPEQDGQLHLFHLLYV